MLELIQHPDYNPVMNIIEKRVLLFVSALFFFCGTTICYASLKDRYTERRGENEYVLHIFEQKLKASKSNKIVKDIKYDYTYVQSSDSIVMLSTIRVPAEIGIPEYVECVYCGKNLILRPELIYVSPEKNKLEYRLRVRFSFKEWAEMISCELPYEIIYNFSNADKIFFALEFSHDKAKWSKLRKELLQIKNLIMINTGRL